MGQLLFTAYTSIQTDPVTMQLALAAVPYPAADVAAVIRQLYNQQFQTAAAMASFLAQQHYSIADAANILKTLYPAATGTAAEMAALLQTAYGASAISVTEMASAFAAAPYTPELSAPVLKQLYGSSLPDAPAMAALLLAAFTQPAIDANNMAQALAASPYPASETAAVIQLHYASSVPDAPAMAGVLFQAPYQAADVAPVLKNLYPSQTDTAAKMLTLLATPGYTAIQVVAPLKTIYPTELAQASALVTLLMATYTSPVPSLNTMALALAAAPYTAPQAAPALREAYSTELPQASQMADLLVQIYTAPVMTAAVMASSLAASIYAVKDIAVLLRQRYATDTNTALKLATLLYNGYQSPILTAPLMLQALATVSYSAWAAGPAMHQYYASVMPDDLAAFMVQAYSDLTPVTLGMALSAAQVQQQSLTGAVLAAIPGTQAGVIAVMLLMVNSDTITNALNKASDEKQQGKTFSEVAIAIMQAYPNTGIPELCTALMSVCTPPVITAPVMAAAVSPAMVALNAAELAKGIMALFPASMVADLYTALQAAWQARHVVLTPADAATGIVAGFTYLTLPVSQTDVAKELVSQFPVITINDLTSALKTGFGSAATADSVLAAMIAAAAPRLVPATAAPALTAVFALTKPQLQTLANSISAQFVLTRSPNTVASMALSLKASSFALTDVSAALNVVYSPNWTPDDYGIVLGVYNDAIWAPALQSYNQGNTVQATAPALKTSYPATSADAMCSVLASTYYLIITAVSVVPMAQAMKAAGYPLAQTVAAMKLQYQPDWTPQDYQQVLNVYNTG
jgi:hypothetical protein